MFGTYSLLATAYVLQMTIEAAPDVSLQIFHSFLPECRLIDAPRTAADSVGLLTQAHARCSPMTDRPPAYAYTIQLLIVLQGVSDGTLASEACAAQVWVQQNDGDIAHRVPAGR